jgi:hypothetical protein
MTSQTRHQITSEKRIGTFLPKRVMSNRSLNSHGDTKASGR